MGGDLAELEVEVDDHDPVRLARAAAIATLVATVEVPTPPFGLWTAIVRRARATVMPSAETTAREVLRALEPQQQRLDPRLELAGVERPRHDVVGAGLEEADPLLDLVGLADAEDRDRRPATASPGSRGRRRRADLSPLTTSTMTSWLVGDLAEGVVGIGART